MGILKGLKKVIIILMYHHITPNNTEHAVSPENFRDQLMALKNDNYNFINVESLERKNRRKLKSDKKYIVITFDDGWLDNWAYAFPVLKQLNIPVSLFLVTGWPCEGDIRGVEELEYLEKLTHSELMKIANSKKTDKAILRWKEIQYMVDSGLVSVQCHSHYHGVSWQNLTQEKNNIMDDIQYSRNVLYKYLNQPCRHFCWPGGRFTPELVNFVSLLDFELQYSTIKGAHNPACLNVPILKRINVINTSGKQLVRKLRLYQSPAFSLMIAFFHKLKVMENIRKTTNIGSIIKWFGI